MRCPNCGGASQSDGSYCIYCGMRLTQHETSLRQDDVKSLRTELIPIVNDRDRTDVNISAIWVILPLIALIVMGVVLVGIIFAAAFDLVESGDYDPDDPYEPYRILSDGNVIVLLAAGVAVYLILARLTHNLVSRHNKHFERERKLRNTVASFASRVTRQRFGYYGMEEAEPRRSPILWAMVVVAPSLLSMLWVLILAMETAQPDPSEALFALVLLIQLSLSLILLVAQFYLFYFLTVEMANHHRRWMAFVRDTKAFLGNVGYTAGWLTEPRRLNDRSIAVYIVVSIFTGGLFIFYWWHAIIKDGNEHFEHHRKFESDLIELLSEGGGGRPEQAPIRWA